MTADTGPSSSELALLLARRQKRLIYWKQRFESENLSKEQASLGQNLCSTFSLLMMKLLRAESEEEKAECEQRLETIERELNNLFSATRHLTSPLGTAVTREPEPGEAGH